MCFDLDQLFVITIVSVGACNSILLFTTNKYFTSFFAFTVFMMCLSNTESNQLNKWKLEIHKCK